jgi:hypothetical protein
LFSFPDEKEVSKHKIHEMYCLEKKDYALQGDKYAETNKYIEVRLKKCRGPACKNSTEIDKVIDDLNFNVIVINAFLDFTKY